MPIFSSDSEDEVAPSSELLSDEDSVHSLLGGGQVANVLLWRDKNISSSIMAAVTIVWFLFEVLEYNFITLLRHSLITSLLIVFIWSTVAVIRYNIWNPEPGWEAFLNNLVLAMALQHNLPLLILPPMAVLLLWLVSFIGSCIGFVNLLFFGTLCLGTLPFLYERYKKEVDYFVRKVYKKIRKTYKKFYSNVLDRIPKGSVKEKKTI